MLTPVTIRVEETKGETDDPDEQNVNLVVPKTAIANADIHADFYANSLPDIGIITLSGAVSETVVDLQEVQGESDDPDETNLQIVVPKALFVTPPAPGTELQGFTTAHALVVASE